MAYFLIYLAMITGALCTIVALTAMRRWEKHNVGKFGWLILVLLTPPVGLLLFLFFSGKRVSAEHDERDNVALPAPRRGSFGSESDQPDIAVKRGLPAPGELNRLKFLTTPESMRHAVLELIDSAQDRVLFHSFILIDDSLGHEIIDRLCEKADGGVEVRLMVDGFGSYLFPNELLEKLDRAGGTSARFKPLSKWSRFAYSNFRNHRKMLIVDGWKAMIGGANFVDYEMTDSPDEATWIDYSARIDGDAARQIEAVFLSDWNFATDEGLQASEEDVPCFADDDTDRATLQTIPVGPDGPVEILGDVWLAAINNASERIGIVTPYFVPPPMALRALAMAARRGVEVTIIIPDESDMPPADQARFDYTRDLAEAGARIFRLKEKMIHAKMLLVDDSVAYLGSANFDMRSFFLNYELVVAVWNKDKIQELLQWFEKLSGRCTDSPAPDTFRRKLFSLVNRVFAEEL